MSIYSSLFILIYCLILSFILGTVFGSFLNCVAGRIKAHEKWWAGKSKCDSCGHELGFFDLFPILSYIFLKGQCRYCGAKMTIKYFFTELILGILFMIYVGIHGLIDIELIHDLGLICVLYGLSLCDLDTFEIPDGFIIFGTVWWLIFQFIEKKSLQEIGLSILIALIIPLAVLLISCVMDKIMKKETLGGGDIKLLFLIGLTFGFAKGLLNLMVSCIIGLIFVLILKKDKIPFGPAISIAAYITLLFGTGIVSWYMSLFY